MSFGFGVGDFLAVLELANKVRQKWNDAPDEYSTMKYETKNVSTLLETVHTLSQQSTLSEQHIVQIKDSSANCLKVLQRCDSLADKFSATSAGHSSLKSKWKRLQLDPDDVRAIRQQLISCVSSLNALLMAIQYFQVNEISEGVDGIRDREAGVLLSTIADWYGSDDFAKHQDYYFSLRHSGTGLWALEDPKYKQWVDGGASTLLCPGIPGSGKSILHATMVNDLCTRYELDDSVIVVYFYCSFQRLAEQTIRNMLSVLVRQMFQERNHLPRDVEALYDKHCRRKTSPSVNELEQLLHSLIQDYHKVFILMDAMDECMSDERDCTEFLDKIFDLQRSKNAISLLVTTRWIPRIIEHFGACPQLEIRARQEDIERYLDDNISRLPVKPHVKIKVDSSMVTIQDAVKSRVVDAADGMFLLARLQFESLTDKTNPRKLQQALLQLSGGSTALESEYDKALVRIDQQRDGFRELAYKVLTWIVYARRELYIDELREAVAIYEGMDDIDHETDLDEEEQLASVCAGLVRIDREAGVMRLVHHTTQRYLEKVLPKRSEGEIAVARDCLTYLTMDIFKQSLLEQEPVAYHLLQKYRLFWYASDHWGRHIKPEFEQDLIPYIDGLLSSPELVKAAIRFLFEDVIHDVVGSTAVRNDLYTEYTVFNPEFRFGLPPAHVCAYFGMSSTLSRIIDQGGAIDDKDITGKTPLSWAAKSGHTEVVKLLLEQPDVLVDSRDCQGWTPFSLATFYGHLNIVEILLRRQDVNINATADREGTPLNLAVSQGHVDIVKLLLDRPEVSVEPPPFEGWSQNKFSLLESAIQLQASEMLEVLMEHAYIRGDPSAYSEDDLLLHAAERGTAEQMRYILSTTKADPNTEGFNGWTPLGRAVRNKRTDAVETVRILLNQVNIRTDSKDHDGRTPLSYAAECGSLKIVEALLQRPEINPDSIDNVGRTPLSYAAGSSSEEVVRCLLAHPIIQLNSKDNKGRTPLSYAAIGSRYDIVQIFLEIPKTEMDTTDNSGLTPFLWAVKQDDPRVIELFLRQWLTRSDSARAYASLAQKAIKDIHHVSKDSYLPMPNKILDLLGHCLLYLGYRDSALLAFRQQVKIEQDTLLASHKGTACDGCDMRPVSGARFVCTTCMKFDLCAVCRDKYIKFKTLNGCADHEFLEVRGQKNSDESLDRLDQIVDSLQDQSQMDSGSDSAPAMPVSAEWRKGIEERYRHWGY